MKAFEAMVSLLLLIISVPMLSTVKSGEGANAVRYVMAQDMLNALYNKYGIGMVYPENMFMIEQDIRAMSRETGNCMEYETPFWQSGNCGGKERVTVNHHSIVGNVRLSVIK